MSNSAARPLIVSLGGINMDLVTFGDRLPADGETVVGNRFVTYAGGKGANQSVAVARMERAARWWDGLATICLGHS